MNSKVASKKWISEETIEVEEVFNHSKEMEIACYAITKVILEANNKWTGNSERTPHSLSNRNYIMELVNIQVLDQIIDYLLKLVKSFYKLNPKLARLRKENGLLSSKHDHVFESLCSRRFILLQVINDLITSILKTCLRREDARKMIDLVGIYNNLTGLSYKKFSVKFNICSNTYPNVISETKPITLTKIVQHITPPGSSVSKQVDINKRREAFIENRKAKMKQAQSLIETKNGRNKITEVCNQQNSDSEIPYVSLVTNECILENLYNDDENMNSILQSEEIYIEILLDIVANISPKLLGSKGVGYKPAREQLRKSLNITRIFCGVTSPCTSQNLRQWLFSTFNVNNTPELILAALRILADALGCHASQTGASFALMLQELVTLNNHCEVTWEYILGAPLEDLPIVEQIPILHRLDHSVHTYRLWCLNETRRLASSWSMDDFFRVAHNDMVVCLEQLDNLRFADHTPTIESGNIGVHENEATDDITSVLSSVCGTTSLAHLTMIFPTHAAWRSVSEPLTEHSLYVHTFLDKMLLPVIKATEDITTLNMVLRIMCESWLHHIYVAKVKFTKEGAVQLLADFNEVRNWLRECGFVSDSNKKQMLNNEVLRNRLPGTINACGDVRTESKTMADPTCKQNNWPRSVYSMLFSFINKINKHANLPPQQNKSDLAALRNCKSVINLNRKSLNKLNNLVFCN
ncbi:unnamed protein product [Leptidea sinapis]|uniref:Coiled-coil protein 142 C-terminal domain-containing protein n=1 Tax=Leptidea sinapis TaxID=189913 RepID=A0A5E4PTY5_9NEOP|nr:unnamed protein product [Leptidea sinapis]